MYLFGGIKCNYLYNIILQCNTIPERRDSVICGLIIYLGKGVEDLITEYKVKVFIFVSLFISKCGIFLSFPLSPLKLHS